MRIFICRVCGEDAHTFVQPGLGPGRKAVIQVVCLTPQCDNWQQTTDSRDLASIDQRFSIEDIPIENLNLLVLEPRAVLS
ncbi:MAG: hypothetical protein ABI690_19650 [Chloroflexota bacterium]